MRWSSVKVAAALDQALDDQGRSLDVFLQVNSSGEPQKYGLPPDEVEAFAIALKAYGTLRVRGLMTLAVLSDDQREIRACFERMRDLQRRLQSSDDVAGTYDELSMGMSGDLEIAIEYGATTVRVGQAIFGPRPSPDTYWLPIACTEPVEGFDTQPHAASRACQPVGSAVFFVVAPGVVAGLVPWLISGWDVRWTDVAVRDRPDGCRAVLSWQWRSWCWSALSFVSLSRVGVPHRRSLQPSGWWSVVTTASCVIRCISAWLRRCSARR